MKEVDILKRKRQIILAKILASTIVLGAGMLAQRDNASKNNETTDILTNIESYASDENHADIEKLFELSQKRYNSNRYAIVASVILGTGVVNTTGSYLEKVLDEKKEEEKPVTKKITKK